MDRDGHVGECFWGELLFTAEGGHLLVAVRAGIQVEDYGLRIQVYYPVLRDPVLGVEAGFEAGVVDDGGVRDLDDKQDIGRGGCAMPVEISIGTEQHEVGHGARDAAQPDVALTSHDGP